DHHAKSPRCFFELVIDEKPDIVLSESRQLDLANQLYADKDYPRARLAYESLLTHFPNSAKADEVRLILSLIYVRHIENRDRARELLAALKRDLQVPGLSALADQLRGELST
ncbi:MAG: hypothetical protein AAF432_05340, partial [Planctomycetota bacterium]